MFLILFNKNAGKKVQKAVQQLFKPHPLFLKGRLAKLVNATNDRKPVAMMQCDAASNHIESKRLFPGCRPVGVS